MLSHKIKLTKFVCINDMVTPHIRGEGSLIFSYLPRFGPFFGVQNFEFQYFEGFLWGMKIFLTFSLGGGGVLQNWTIFGGRFYVFKGFFFR